MKKVIGLCLVVLMSSVSVFAQEGKRGDKKGGDPTQRMEKMIKDLDLNEQQAADFRKIEAEYREKMKVEREQAKSDRENMREKMQTMKENRNAEIKKILTEEQYTKFLEKQNSQSPRKGDNRRK